MLTVTVRFYVTTGGLVGILIGLGRLIWVTSAFKKGFDSFVTETRDKFTSQEADIRELRARRR